MARKCNISSYTPPSWWEPIIPYSYYPSSNMSSCEDHQLDHLFNVSTNHITDSSDHSRMTGEDSSRETFVVDDHFCHQSVLNEWTDEDALSSQLWTHVVLDGRSNIGEFGDNQEDDFNLVNANLWTNNNNTAPISPEVIFEPDRGKQVLQLPRQIGKWHGTQNNEGKKKRIFEEASPTSVKKPKKESSIAVKAPKQKCREKVNALHEIVSPYGKTDEASVLLETIQHIKNLQGEVQILSNPYMKNLHKNQWPGSLEITEKRDYATKVDLKSWGLALVPISCLPQEYQESGELDYWTPTYRSCFYR